MMTLFSLSVSATELFRAEHVPLPVLLYVGPDQILPLTSFLGVIVGIILMFWRYLVGLAGRVRQFFSRH
jgi:hypothetical protein